MLDLIRLFLAKAKLKQVSLLLFWLNEKVRENRWGTLRAPPVGEGVNSTAFGRAYG
jgi:hypothetical protein